ncbi:MAG: ice-binding family protein [Patescibacteria group bacterium]
MKKFNKKVSVVILAVLMVLGLSGPMTALAAGPAAVNLLTAGNFSILSKTGITNTGSHTSVILGNIGSSPITAAAMNNVFCSEITGTIYGTNAAYVGSGDQACFAGNPPLSNMTLVDDAVLDMEAAYSNAALRPLPDSVEPFLGNIGGQTFAPGLYKWSTDVNVASDVTLSGGSSDVWIFQIAGDLNIASGGSVPAGIKVLLIGGAQASNIFWQVGGPTGATLGTYSTFNGNILSAKQIIMQTGAILYGRALAQTQVTLDANNISTPTTTPATLHVIKQVVNNSGGTATSSNFNLHVKLSGVDVVGSPAVGTTTPGTTYSLAAGTYVVSEDINASYVKSFSGDCDASGNVTLASGANKTCTITNTDIPPVPATLHVIKLVVNGNGGTAVPADFNVHLKNAGVDVAGSPAVGTSIPGTAYSLAAGTYVISEDANTSYVKSFSGNCDSNGSITLAAGTDRTCTIINTDIPVPAPSGGGGSMGTPLVPVIGISKVPTPLALSDGPGSVTYNYNVWNVGGQLALINVKVSDDKCSSVSLWSGDLNNNSKLDPGENWRYRCVATLSDTTTNTAIATGYGDDAYRQIAVATAVATVVVGAPLPAPLINIVKVPSRLTPFPFGGGNVKYTYTVTNPGVVTMDNVTVVDDKCSPVSIVSGDIDDDGLLDPSEKWVYTCQTNVAVSTRNIATVEGRGNGFIALGYAFANVLVSSPSLPNAGVPPLEESLSWNFVIFSGLFLLVSTALFLVLRKHKS